MTEQDFTGLKAMFINCTLKRSPELSHTEGLVDASAAIMFKNGVSVEVCRAVDHDIATGVYPDMTEHGWATRRVAGHLPAGPRQRHPRDRRPDLARRQLQRHQEGHRAALRAVRDLINDEGQYLFYGRVAAALITGNEDGIKHCAQNILYSLQHIGYTIPPQADAGWIGEAGPGPSYLDPGSGGPENDFTNRNTTFMTWNLMHLARMLKDAGGIPAHGNQRSEWDAGSRFDFENPEYR